MQCAFLSRNFSLQSRTVNFSFVISSIGFAYYVGPFLCLPVRRGFKSLNAFKMHVIFHCTWSYGSLLNVSSVTFHLPENLQRKNKEYRISLAWYLYGYFPAYAWVRRYIYSNRKCANAQLCVTLFEALSWNDRRFLFSNPPTQIDKSFNPSLKPP